MNTYAQWFGRVVWLGIIVNMFFVIPLLFFPEALLDFLKMEIPSPVIWVRAAGLLLLEISIIYIPAAQDPYRYKALAWMIVLVTRGGGSSFFIGAVLFFQQNSGFLTIALVDLFFGVVEGILLYLAFSKQPINPQLNLKDG